MGWLWVVFLFFTVRAAASGSLRGGGVAVEDRSRVLEDSNPPNESTAGSTEGNSSTQGKSSESGTELSSYITASQSAVPPLKLCVDCDWYEVDCLVGCTECCANCYWFNFVCKESCVECDTIDTQETQAE